MARYIDAEEFEKKIVGHTFNAYLNNNIDGANTLLFNSKFIYETLWDQPTVDVHEIIRCKDCQFFKTDAFGQKICVKQFNIIRMNENDFCSYGKRKESESNG